MPHIAADSDVYGKYARLSALADYVEVRALKGDGLRQAGLADLIADNGWQLPELVEAPEGFQPDNLAEALDESRDAADRVMALLRERADLLGDEYPFVIQGQQLVLRPGTAPLEDPYIALLSVTICHAFELASDPAPHAVFEDLVGRALGARLTHAINFGRLRRENTNFDSAVSALSSILHLQADARRGWRMKRAQDENVDAVAHFSWSDQRPGLWTFIGQATVGMSESWERKINEPSATTWASFLGATPPPQVFLAVPHHVETRLLHKLVQDNGRVILDRVRLARFKGTNSGEEKFLIQRVIDTPVADQS